MERWRFEFCSAYEGRFRLLLVEGRISVCVILFFEVRSTAQNWFALIHSGRIWQRIILLSPNCLKCLISAQTRWISKCHIWLDGLLRIHDFHVFLKYAISVIFQQYIRKSDRCHICGLDFLHSLFKIFGLAEVLSRQFSQIVLCQFLHKLANSSLFFDLLLLIIFKGW